MRWLAALPLLVSAACASPKLRSFDIRVQAESDPGVPLSGVSIARAGSLLGTSNTRGRLAASLTGRTGERVQLDVDCPAGFTAATQWLEITLRPREPRLASPMYAVRCRPQLRTLVIAVRAPRGIGIPLRHLGRELARTDAQGVAHALLHMPPNEDVRLVLDTSGPEHRSLRPQNPELKMSVADRDEVVLFDQPFVVHAPKPARVRAVAKPLPLRF